MAKQKPGSNVCIVSSDPGGMSGDSNLGADHAIIKASKAVLGIIAPLLNRLKKDAYNSPMVPAKAIMGLFDHLGSIVDDRGSYYILDDKLKSNDISLNKKKQDEVLDMILGDLDMTLEI